jgi:hypothetical protein
VLLPAQPATNVSTTVAVSILIIGNRRSRCLPADAHFVAKRDLGAAVTSDVG